MKSGLMLALVVALVLLVTIGLTGVGIYNGLVIKEQVMDQTWAQVQNVYQRRADLIPNLVATVSGAANFEKSTLTEITAARASVGQVKLDPNAATLSGRTSAPNSARRYGRATTPPRLSRLSGRSACCSPRIFRLWPPM